MFTKKNKSENNHEKNTTSPENQATLQSWITGKVGSFLLFSAVGYALYHFQIIPKISNYFKKDKEKTPTN